MRKVEPEKEDFVGPYTYLINWEDHNIAQNWILMFENAYEQFVSTEYMGPEDIKKLI